MKVAVAVAAALLAATPALAVNEGFELGTTAGWGSVGNTYASTGAGSFVPVYGTFIGVVEAGQQDLYSTLTQTYNLLAGDTLSGFVGFQALDYLPFDDDAYLSVNGVNIFSSNVSAVGDFGNTGWISFSYVAPTAGSYTLQLGVANRLDSGVNSIAVLDAFSTSAGVPEASAWAMLITGFGLVGAASRRRRFVVAA